VRVMEARAVVAMRARGEEVSDEAAEEEEDILLLTREDRGRRREAKVRRRERGSTSLLPMGSRQPPQSTILTFRTLLGHHIISQSQRAGTFINIDRPISSYIASLSRAHFPSFLPLYNAPRSPSSAIQE
jgi:hypothetical protein